MNERQRQLAILAVSRGGASITDVATFAETTPDNLRAWVRAAVDETDPRHADAAPFLAQMQQAAAQFMARKAHELRPYMTQAERDQVDELLAGWDWLQSAPTWAAYVRAAGDQVEEGAHV